MARLPDPTTEPLSPEDEALLAELSAKRGHVGGMYRSLLNHPDLLRHIAGLGTFFRFGDSVLPDLARETVILHLAARLKVGYEWIMHQTPAAKAGLSPDDIAAIKVGRAPDGPDPALAPALGAALRAADAALDLADIPPDTQAAVIAAWGVKGVIELVALCGFYRLIAGVIRAFEAPLPEWCEDPFAAPNGP